MEKINNIKQIPKKNVYISYSNYILSLTDEEYQREYGNSDTK